MSTATYEKEYAVNVLGQVTGERFEGKFKVRTRLSFKDQLRRDEIRRTLLGTSPNGTPAYERAASAADMFSELAIRITEAPTWWKNADNGLDMADDNVLTEVHKQALLAEKELVDSIAKKGEEAKKALAQAAPVGA